MNKHSNRQFIKLFRLLDAGLKNQETSIVTDSSSKFSGCWMQALKINEQA